LRLEGGSRLPQKDVVIQPRPVYTSSAVAGIGEEDKQPSVIANEYSMLQPGIVERRPLKAHLNIAQDWKNRRRNVLIGIDGNVLGVGLVPEEQIGKQHQRRIERESQHN
jgi:hypothetical protein